MGKENKDNKVEQPKMANKTKFYLLLLLVGVGLTVWAMVDKDKNLMDSAKGKLALVKDRIGMDDDEDDAEEENEKPGWTEMGANPLPVSTASYLEGRLENSDNQAKGNLKLISSLSHIYIKTSRDFSSLIGSDVLMHIDGTMESFALVSIEKKVGKDGFLQQ